MAAWQGLSTTAGQTCQRQCSCPTSCPGFQRARSEAASATAAPTPCQCISIHIMSTCRHQDFICTIFHYVAHVLLELRESHCMRCKKLQHVLHREDDHVLLVRHTSLQLLQCGWLIPTDDILFNG